MDIEPRRAARVALPVAVAVVGLAVAWPTAHVELGLGAASALVAGLAAAVPVALAGVAPVPAWALSALGAAIMAATVVPGLTGLPVPVAHLVALLGLLLVVGVRSALPAAAAAAVATLVLVGLIAPAGARVALLAAVAMVLIVALLVRRLAGSQHALERERAAGDAERARRAVLEERARIARDLHDVVAHSMSMVVVRAQTARYRVPDVSEAAAAELAALADAAREALSEVRGVLGVLRDDDAPRDGGAHRPQPGPEDVDALLHAAEQAGMTLTVARTGAPDRAGAAVTVSLHRILQEALTNAARHAGGAPVAVSLDHGDDAVRLRVANPAGTASTARGSGLGLPGMRERAAAVGGELTAVGDDGGGFTVTAVLPVAPHPAGVDA